MKGAESIKQSLDKIPNKNEDVKIHLPKVDKDIDKAKQKRLLAGTSLESPTSKKEVKLQSKPSVTKN